MTTGKFITVEGIEGAGKTTAIKSIEESLRLAGRTPLVTREPGGTGLGREIRQMVLHGEHLSPVVETLLFAADRGHHADLVLWPALRSGVDVICDRYIDSSVAYQTADGHLTRDVVWNMSMTATGGLVPDLTILLDLDPAVGLERVGQRGQKDRMESKIIDFHRKVREGFLAQAADDPTRFIIVDATQPADVVGAHVAVAVAKRFSLPWNRPQKCGFGGDRYSPRCTRVEGHPGDHLPTGL